MLCARLVKIGSLFSEFSCTQAKCDSGSRWVIELWPLWPWKLGQSKNSYNMSCTIIRCVYHKSMMKIMVIEQQLLSVFNFSQSATYRTDAASKYAHYRTRPRYCRTWCYVKSSWKSVHYFPSYPVRKQNAAAELRWKQHAPFSSSGGIMRGLSIGKAHFDLYLSESRLWQP